jgi:hypothetical protein
VAVEASHNKTKTHTNKLWSKNYEYGFNKFKLFVTLINKNNTFFFLKNFQELSSLVFIYLSRVVYLLLYVFICQELSTFSCIYLFVKSCLPSLVFFFLLRFVYLLLYLFISQKLSTFSCIYLFVKSCLPSLEFIYLPSCLPSPVFFLSAMSCLPSLVFSNSIYLAHFTNKILYNSQAILQ